VNDQRLPVPEYLCQRWRLMIQSGWKISEIDADTFWHRETVQRHIHGKCSHSPDNSVGSLYFNAGDIARLRSLYSRNRSPLLTSMAMCCHPNTVTYHTKDLR